MRRSKYLSAVRVPVFLVLTALVSRAGELAPPFSLSQWGTDRQFALRNCRGAIVVLDFFSASCGDCFRASRELQRGVQEYYAARGGNAHGIRVQVVAVSTEVPQPGEMEVFTQETGVDLVLDDNDGAILGRYGGNDVPYVVVIDATGPAETAPPPRVVYRYPGFAGLGPLRRVIDGITGQVELPAAIPPTRGAAAPAHAVSLVEGEAGAEAPPAKLAALEVSPQSTHRVGVDFATLAAADVLVTETLTEYRQTVSAAELSLSLSHRYIEVHHESTYLDVVRRDDLSSHRVGLQSKGRFGVGGPLTLTLDGGFYEGYQNYRSLWLNEYYRHRLAVLRTYFPEMQDYEEAEPWGCNVSTALRWEYLPAAGSVEAGFSYQHEVVAPGYEWSLPPVRLRDRYDTRSGRLSFENVLSRRVRALGEFQIDDTTDRELRFTLRESVNCALSEHWVLRLALAGAKEDPEFESKSAGAALERDWHGTWFVSLFGRYYRDTGETENAVAESAAAPPLDTYQVGLGLRRQGQRSSFKLAIGPCYSRYRPENRRPTEFDELYQDRNWLSVQFAFVVEY